MAIPLKSRHHCPAVSGHTLCRHTSAAIPAVALPGPAFSISQMMHSFMALHRLVPFHCAPAPIAWTSVSMGSLSSGSAHARVASAGNGMKVCTLTTTGGIAAG